MPHLLPQKFCPLWLHHLPVPLLSQRTTTHLCTQLPQYPLYPSAPWWSCHIQGVSWNRHTPFSSVLCWGKDRDEFTKLCYQEHIASRQKKKGKRAARCISQRKALSWMQFKNHLPDHSRQPFFDQKQDWNAEVWKTTMSRFTHGNSGSEKRGKIRLHRFKISHLY